MCVGAESVGVATWGLAGAWRRARRAGPTGMPASGASIRALTPTLHPPLSPPPARTTPHSVLSYVPSSLGSLHVSSLTSDSLVYKLFV